MHPPAPQPQVWQPLTLADLPDVAAIAEAAHPLLPERLEVFAEKLSLFPAGCRKLIDDGRMAGYAIAHPWRYGDPPRLDTLLRALPARPDTLFIHDIALAPDARGRGAAAAVLADAAAIARAAGLPSLTLVAAYGTARLWRRFGFDDVADPALAAKLAAYGADAVYLLRRLP
jgi:ribosomal protein S18 acetylase RimI-like enzyme